MHNVAIVIRNIRHSNCDECWLKFGKLVMMAIYYKHVGKKIVFFKDKPMVKLINVKSKLKLSYCSYVSKLITYLKSL